MIHLQRRARGHRPATQWIEDVEEGAGKHVSNLGCVAGSTSDEANFTAAAAAAADGCMGEQEKAREGRTDGRGSARRQDRRNIHPLGPAGPSLAARAGGAEGGRRASNVLYPN